MKSKHMQKRVSLKNRVRVFLFWYLIEIVNLLKVLLLHLHARAALLASVGCWRNRPPAARAKTRERNELNVSQRMDSRAASAKVNSQ